jgi:hypothetical protein
MGRRGWSRGSEQRAADKQQRAADKLERRREKRRQVTLGTGNLPPGLRPGEPANPRDTTAARSLEPEA